MQERVVKDVEGNEVRLTIDPSRIVAESVSPVGDVNEDGVFNSLDLVQLLQAGKYGTGQPATYAQGDFDGGGLVRPVRSGLCPARRAVTRAAPMPVSPEGRRCRNDAQNLHCPNGTQGDSTNLLHGHRPEERQ